MSMNRNKLADLDRRATVPELTIALLRRARGLDLIHKPEEQAQYVTKTEHLGYRPGLYESSAGYDYDADIDNCHVILVTEEVNYPVQGYPEAYDNTVDTFYDRPTYAHEQSQERFRLVDKWA